MLETWFENFKFPHATIMDSVEVLIPKTSERDLFGDKVFKGVIILNEVAGVAKIQYDWYPYKNEILGQS